MILNIYKPKGISSFAVVGMTKRKYDAKKAGHAGTLDPLAEGVMVVLTGDDTKKQDDFMHQPKEYIADITFGVVSDTMDLEHTSTVVNVISLDEVKAKLPNLINKYIGEYEQQIPNFSAKKLNGKPLYKIARENPEKLTDLKMVKSVQVQEIKIMSFGSKVITTDQGDLDLPFVELKISCSAGFFVRSLADDLGKDLKCGGVLSKLVRTKVGNFSIENSIHIE